MTNPELNPEQSEQKILADAWLADARAQVANDDQASDDERLYYLDCIAMAKDFAGVLPKFESQLATLQSIRNDDDPDVFGLQVARLPKILFTVQEQIDLIK